MVRFSYGCFSLYNMGRYFFFFWWTGGAIETLGAGGGGITPVVPEGGWSHPLTSGQVAVHHHPSLLPCFAGLPCSLWNLTLMHKKNHLYSNIPVISFANADGNTHICCNYFISMSAKVDNIFDSCNDRCEKSTSRSNKFSNISSLPCNGINVSFDNSDEIMINSSYMEVRRCRSAMKTIGAGRPLRKLYRWDGCVILLRHGR